jgi:hypothetical protein
LAAAQAALLRPGSSPAQDVHRPPLWEDLYQNASPAQQQELLSLAGRQGLLYSHQLPPLNNGARAGAPAEETASGQLLSRLLSGNGHGLEPVRVHSVATLDAALDPAQREAVARALNTPDICLIQGLPGTGKSRVAAEIVTLAAAQGQRVLLLAASAAAIDRVLLQAGTSEAVCPLRCLGRDEPAETLPPAVRALTFSQRVRALGEQTLQRAQAALETDEQRCRRCRQDETVWPRLEEMADRFQNLQAQLIQLHQRGEGCPAEVEREAQGIEQAVSQAECPSTGPLGPELGTLWATHQQTLTRLDAERGEVKRRLAERQAELAGRTPDLEALQPLAEAKQKGRWWTGAWWRATFRGHAADRLEELEKQQKETSLAIAGLEADVRRLDEERAAADRTYRAQRLRRLEAEIARRRMELDDQETALEHEQAQLRDKWQRGCRELDAGSAPPAELSPSAVAGARAEWGRRLEQEEQRLAFTREWVNYLREAAGTLAARLPDYVNVVAATVSGLATDEHFGDQAASNGPFDLLVLEEAEQVTEAEFLKMARRARRWVLIGGCDLETRADVSVPARAEAASSLRRVAPALFPRLWGLLHCDPRRLPYAWIREKDRLCCRLRPLTAEQRQRLETERVADFPEIELRILALPRLQPLLAEVVFPPSMTIQQAKEYIYRELQELPVQATAPCLRWVENPEQLALQLADQPAHGTVTVSLESGVREIIGVRGELEDRAPKNTTAPSSTLDTPRLCSEVPWPTCRVEFERGAGWERERAEQWVRRYLGVCDLGRTARLDVPQRIKSPLAGFLSDLLFGEGGGYRQTHAGPGQPAPGGLEFVAVPSSTGDNSSRRRGEADGRARGNGARVAAPPPPRTARGGAGLEVDLATSRHADRLPAELRANLPSRGVVNYLEAQAVVRKLEALVADPARRVGGEDRVVAVLALYQAQAELIRRLIQQSPGLTAAGLEVEVDVPAGFRHREAPVVLLSLTRSHSHRAVSYGEGPQALALALTRARDRLIVFGDPGTLARRSQWSGALDHLDEGAADCERQLVTRLLQITR